MKPSDEQQHFMDLYKSALHQEVRADQVQSHKKALVREHFSAQPTFAFQPFFWMPAMALLMALMILLGLEMRLYPVSKIAPQLQQELLIRQSEDAISGPRVRVKRVSSRVGPTLVYQKNINNLPVTIIWVFPKGMGA